MLGDMKSEGMLCAEIVDELPQQPTIFGSVYSNTAIPMATHLAALDTGTLFTIACSPVYSGLNTNWWPSQL